MFSTESPALNDIHPERDVGGEHAPFNGGYRQKPGRPYRSSDKDLQFRSDEPPKSRRVARSVALFTVPVLVGVGGTLASQSYRDKITQVFPPLGWLSPVSTMKAPAPAVTTADLQDLALVRRSIEQLASNQAQLARRARSDGTKHRDTAGCRARGQSESFSPAANTQAGPRFSQTGTTASTVNLLA